MKLRLPLPLFLLPLLLSGMLQAQKDSVLYSPDFKFQEGIYLSFADFRSNHPIPKSAIISQEDKNALVFLRNQMLQKIINYTDSSGKLQTVAPYKLWGYCENNSPYIFLNGDFNKIVVVGSLCHFTATYTSYMTSGPMMGGGVSAGTPEQSMQQYVLDMQTGKVMDFVLPNMEIVFQRDPDLYKEFMALRKNKRKQLLFFYLRKYNDRHPLYF